MKSIIIFLSILFSINIAFGNANLAEVANNLSSLEQWSQLSPDEQTQILDYLSIKNTKVGKWDNVNTYSLSQFQNLSEGIVVSSFVKTAEDTYEQPEKALSKEQSQWIVEQFLRTYPEAIGEFEVDGENLTSYGEPWVRFTVTMIGDDILAVQYHITQDGAYSEVDASGPHFESEQEAMAAGWDTGADVSWSNHFLVNHQGELIDYNSYWERTGS